MVARGNAGRRRRGVALLELLLIMPLYVFCLVAILALSDLGLSLTGAHVGGRYLAWKRAPVEVGVAQAMAGSTFTAVPLSEQFVATLANGRGEDESVVSTTWKPAVDIAAAFVHSSESTLFANLDATRRNGSPTMRDIMPAESDALLMAMSGFLSEASGEGDSWLRRRYAVASFGLRENEDGGYMFTPRSRSTLLMGAFGPETGPRQTGAWLDEEFVARHQWHQIAPSSLSERQ